MTERRCVGEQPRLHLFDADRDRSPGLAARAERFMDAVAVPERLVVAVAIPDRQDQHVRIAEARLIDGGEHFPPLRAELRLSLSVVQAHRAVEPAESRSAFIRSSGRRSASVAGVTPLARSALRRSGIKAPPMPVGASSPSCARRAHTFEVRCVRASVGPSTHSSMRRVTTPGPRGA
jgi:hypothetical protein